MGTKVYGASDDLIEIEGDVEGEVSCFGTDDRNKGVLLVFSDGTLLEVKYGKSDLGIWGIRVFKKGDLFDSKVDAKMKMRKFIATSSHSRTVLSGRTRPQIGRA